MELEINKEAGSLDGGYRWKEHKIKILRVNPEILGMLCLQSAKYQVTSGLPDDARCLGVHIDIYTGDILLKIESEEFEPVEQGAEVPELDAKMLVIETIDIGYRTGEEYDTDREISEIVDLPCVSTEGE